MILTVSISCIKASVYGTEMLQRKFAASGLDTADGGEHMNMYN